MKFSFSLIKKLVPGRYTKSELTEKLNLHSFETADLGGDVLEIAVTPNRFSDAASHLGIAREAAAIFGIPLKDPLEEKLKYGHKDQGVFRVNVKEKNLCRRYLASYVSKIKVGPSPKWLKEVLETCGLRSINNVVDIMNYVMLEIGQPLHAFDADKVSGGLVARRAQKGETITTIDNQKFNLDSEVLVIADAKQPLAIAGIKGGKSSEVTSGTKRILVEAAHFESANIYKTSRKLALRTDASVRFSHFLSPELPELGMRRALALLQELAAATIHPPIDVYAKKAGLRLVPFNLKKMSDLIGEHFKEKEVLQVLSNLGFKKKGKSLSVPALRMDIDGLEDIAEEVARIKGYNNLPSRPPSIALGAAQEEEQINLKNRLRKFSAGVGFSEVYNYSFLAEKEVGSRAVAIANPISSQAGFLRDSLKMGLRKNLESNKRFFEEVRVFEIGKVFSEEKGRVEERLMLGMGILAKNSYLEIKGVLDSLLTGLGIIEYELIEKNPARLEVKLENLLVGNLDLISELKNAAVLELNLDLLLKEMDEEREFAPLPKFPVITRDLSIFVPEETRVGEVLEMIQRVSAKLVNDVDLIDFYEPDEKLRPKQDRSETQEKRRKSLTFRIVFQAEDRTLTDAEADREMAAINQILIDKFDAELR
ncbi:MAG: phenylalanine--tRNA ligase subunit beta [Candidatus Harrisonbacteria bacterium]|nr:phenylalanine--tRNA ligase subunit beta [Candidatus Harrisonbacteria bacterium]